MKPNQKPKPFCDLSLPEWRQDETKVVAVEKYFPIKE
jgi:hypothetical protein